MGAVNPSLITTLIFKKRPVQNVLQQLAFAINARASVNQVMTRRVALAGGTGPISVSGVLPYYPNTNAPVLPADYDYFAPPLVAADGAKMPVGARGATRLPSNLTGTEVTLSVGWAPAIAAGGDIYRYVAITRYRVGVAPSLVGDIGPGTLAMPVSGEPQPEGITLQVGPDVQADDYLVVTAYRDASNVDDTFPSGVSIVALDLTYQETVTLAS